MSSYGYMSMYKPPAPPRLAQAAASKDPYGLAPNNRSGPLGIGSSSGFAAPSPSALRARRAPAEQAPGATVAPNDPRIAASLAANPYAAGSDGNLFAYQAPTAAGVNNYDLNTDPALQSIQSLVGQSNQQANAGALKQRQNLVLAYGDPAVAKAVLGADDPIAAAAAQNPTSTVAQLGQSRDRNLKTLDDQLNADNLGYSGYRVLQETQAGQDYQNALASAAAGLNSNLDTVDSNLAAALAGNNGQLVSGINSAADRANQNATATGTDPGAITDQTGPGAFDPGALANAGGFVSSGGYGAAPMEETNAPGAASALARAAGSAFNDTNLPPQLTQPSHADLLKLLSNVRRPGVQLVG